MGEGTQEEGWVVCRIFKKKNHHKTLDSPISSSLNAEITRNHMFSACNEGALEQMLEYMGRNNCKEDDSEENNSARFLIRPIDTAMISNIGYCNRDSFMKLPSLESPNSNSCTQNCYQPMMTDNNEGSITNNSVYQNVDSSSGLTNWAALDRLVASQLNGQTETSRQLACFNDQNMPHCASINTHHHDHDLQLPALRSSSSSSILLSSNRSNYHGTTHDYNSSEIDLWSFTRSSSTLSLSSSDPLCHVVNASV